MSPMLCRRQAEPLERGVELLERGAGAGGHGHRLAVDGEDAAAGASGRSSVCSGAAIAVKLWPVPIIFTVAPAVRARVVRRRRPRRPCRGRPRRCAGRPPRGRTSCATGDRGRGRSWPHARARLRGSGVPSGRRARARHAAGRGHERTPRTRRWWSTTSPASVAPGATPATIPVCRIAIPSVSRPGGHALLDQRHRAIRVGRDREAADEQHDRHQRDRVDERRAAPSRSAIAEGAPAQPDVRPAAPVRPRR